MSLYFLKTHAQIDGGGLVQGHTVSITVVSSKVTKNGNLLDNKGATETIAHCFIKKQMAFVSTNRNFLFKNVIGLSQSPAL